MKLHIFEYNEFSNTTGKYFEISPGLYPNHENILLQRENGQLINMNRKKFETLIYNAIDKIFEELM